MSLKRLSEEELKQRTVSERKKIQVETRKRIKEFERLSYSKIKCGEIDHPPLTTPLKSSQNWVAG
ncbi:MAG: hypothetical protein Q8P84_00525 [Deltaproteobacteria bacterium]|nr:hypothetical protein [Deltaproteobacteria bacterium]